MQNVSHSRVAACRCEKADTGTENPLTIADGLVCLSLSLRISFSMLSLMASLHARWQISVRSAPEKPLVIFARKSKSTSYQQTHITALQMPKL